MQTQKALKPYKTDCDQTIAATTGRSDNIQYGKLENKDKSVFQPWYARWSVKSSVSRRKTCTVMPLLVGAAVGVLNF